MCDHTVLRQIRYDLMVLQQHSCLLKHLAAEGLGELLALWVDFWSEAVRLGEIGFPQGFREQSVSIQQAKVLLQFASLLQIKVELRRGSFVLCRIEVHGIHVVDTDQRHKEHTQVADVGSSLL